MSWLTEIPILWTTISHVVHMSLADLFSLYVKMVLPKNLDIPHFDFPDGNFMSSYHLMAEYASFYAPPSSITAFYTSSHSNILLLIRPTLLSSRYLHLGDIVFLNRPYNILGQPLPILHFSTRYLVLVPSILVQHPFFGLLLPPLCVHPLLLMLTVLILCMHHLFFVLILLVLSLHYFYVTLLQNCRILC